MDDDSVDESEEIFYLCPSGESDDSKDALQDYCDCRTVPLLMGTKGQLKLNEEALKELLDPAELTQTPIVVISIAGAFRKGKSFVMNFLLRYLQKQGWKSRDDAWLKGWKSTENQSMKWEGGADGVTQGIVALKKPIIVEDKNGDKLAVILLDTQGNFEQGRSRQDNVKIFALSTLFSSFQIFNISQQIQTNDLDYLQCFVEFSKYYNVEKSSDVDCGARGRKECFFQDLLFLVRDWQKPLSYSYGSQGGLNYLESLARSGQDAQTYKYLKDSFSNVRGFLMPEPSRKVRVFDKKEQYLEASNIGEQFSKYLRDFIEEFFHPDAMKPKTLGPFGPVTASELLQHVKDCSQEILSGEQPEFSSLIDFIASKVKSKALKETEEIAPRVDKALARLKKVLWSEADEMVDAEITKARLAYKVKTRFGVDQKFPDNLKEFDERVEFVKLKAEKFIQERRCTYMQHEIKNWLEESKRRLQFRKFPLTDVSDLEKIRDERLKLLPVKHDKDPISVADAIGDAEEVLKTCYDENFREVKRQNSAVKWLAVGSAAMGVIVAGPVAVAGLVLGETAVGTVAALTSGVFAAGVRWQAGIQWMKKTFLNRENKEKEKMD